MVLTGMSVTNCPREDKVFMVDLQGINQGDKRQIRVDAVVLATGFELFDASSIWRIWLRNISQCSEFSGI